MYTIVWGGDAGAEGIYSRATGDMVMSAWEVERLGYRWGGFIGAPDHDVDRWTVSLLERRSKGRK